MSSARVWRNQRSGLMGPSLRYCLTLLGVTATVVGGALAVNLLFDPYWHLDGDKTDDLNIAFNERVAKANRYLATRERVNYECLVFGSSRSILLDQRALVTPGSCFNFSFAGGRIEEFIAYGRWLRGIGADPSYLVVGIDDFNFVELERDLVIPEFVRRGTQPPGMLATYLSLDALQNSARLLLDVTDWFIVYDENLIGTVVEDPPAYRPRIEPVTQPPRADAAAQYRSLRELFPKAYFVAYVPPVSAWWMASKPQRLLAHILCATHELTRSFDAVYDFAVPGEVTRNPNLSYDEDHYAPEINRKIAHRLSGRPGAFGLRVDRMTLAEYLAVYRTALAEFRAGLTDPGAPPEAELPEFFPETLTAAACGPGRLAGRD